MSTTLRIESFKPENIRERTELLEPAAADDSVVKVLSTADLAMGDILYIGSQGREGCEKAVVASVGDSTTLTLATALQHAHIAYDEVVRVLGDSIRIYRAPNVDDTIPADGSFVSLATRSIDPEQLSTYYRDSNGTSDHWYKFTYTNLDTGAETDLSDSTAVRGQDFGNYCSLREIREEAGFLDATNLRDTMVEQCRSNAQNEINAALRNVYGKKVPFNPVPGAIKTLTIQLAAAYLLQTAYPGRKDLWEPRFKAARTKLESLQNKDDSLTDDGGEDLVDSSIGFYPTDDQSRAFTMDMRF
ncbi:DUF1320 domain-containing protein [Streptomyces sp. SID6673]|nr:DUF1320 domain-containing protein [Streptomyces sp. SID11726]NDZ94940.1 DUF1320 domain-containing protein [Streptomyces sp. SID11726]NEB23099.1 DUF1320 domain-containing protein [Streptomyces sp. SID6673]